MITITIMIGRRYPLIGLVSAQSNLVKPEGKICYHEEHEEHEGDEFLNEPIGLVFLRALRVFRGGLVQSNRVKPEGKICKHGWARRFDRINRLNCLSPG
jgi:hypothetical protein